MLNLPMLIVKNDQADFFLTLVYQMKSGQR